MDLSQELERVSQDMAAAAATGCWDAVSRELWRRADVLAGLREGAAEAGILRSAGRAGEEVREAVLRLRIDLETELRDLRAARRSAAAWRPYREGSGASVDVSS